MARKGENIYKRKDGRWEGRYIKSRSSTGKANYGYVYAKSYREVKAKLISQSSCTSNSVTVDPEISSDQFEQVAMEWFQAICPKVKESTSNKYRNLLSSYILPVFGSKQLRDITHEFIENQRIIAGNAQFTGIAAGRGVGFTTGLLLLRKGLGMRETPIRPHSWHCRMQSGYQYGGNRKRPPVWRRHRGSLRPRGRNLGGVEGMTGGCGSGCDPAIHTRRLRVYHRPRRLRMASRISIFFAARRFEPLNSMG